MPRSIWNGTIAFGLMTVPVKLHTATESKTVHFSEGHLDDGARIEHRRFCSKEDKEVEYKEVVKGYEVSDREYLVAVRAVDGVLFLHTLRFADELVAGSDVDVAEPSRGPGKREVEMAQRLIDTLHERFDAERYEDEYRQAVLDVIERKAKGEEIAVAEEPESDDSDDLMAVLEASLGGAKKGGR